MADSSGSPDSTVPDDHPVRTILIVDDDEGIGEFLTTALMMEANYRALLLTNGTEALAAVNTLVPDLFILDYQLPGINGLELADCLHAIDVLTHVPILLMSANLPKRELEQRSLAFIEKPFELETFLHIIETLLAP